ncbi:helix-turn-helix transcriptional regulator (plasmid) [Ruegeria conchae]|uniref:helix-turn-helix transcriptional regulator n=1 Tax=Ruegeria conchae TaxID=981384 RepID=UPI0021A77BE9|nr:helix-turn-helix transcriptional regulator [Ruegeria conchae]UWR05218.1 helix-turn-helix transcriptional regulator [Ruegeria conchae]
MANLNLVIAQAIKPAISASDLSLYTLERIADRAGLPPSIVENPAGIVPLHAVEFFLALLQQKVGEQSFLFRSLELDPEENRQTHSVVGIPLPCGLTNFEGLNHLTEKFNSFISGARFFCHRQGDRFWIMRTTAATDWSDEWPTLQYNLAIMQLATRRVLGCSVLPVALALPMFPEKVELHDELRHIPVVQSKDHFGIAFDLIGIVDRNFTLSPTSRTVLDEEPLPIDSNLRQSIISCLSTFLTLSTTDSLSDRVAKAFGISTRTYRRILAEHGTSHARLLADARLNLATKLLLQDNCSITETALELGYGYPGDFTRFFKKRMGVTPAEFRQIYFK